MKRSSHPHSDDAPNPVLPTDFGLFARLRTEAPVAPGSEEPEVNPEPIAQIVPRVVDSILGETA